MAKIDVGHRIIAAVAQEPFVSGGNWFCTLIPICDLEGNVLSDDLFPNRGMIWWRVIEPVRDYAVRRNLIIIQLETAPAYDSVDPSKDYFQVGSVSPLKSLVSEIIPIEEHEDSDSLIREGRVYLDRPVVGSVYFRTGEDVSGPWKVEGEEERGYRRATVIKALQNEKVWRWKWVDFAKRVRVIHRDVRIVIDWHWNKFDTASYTMVFQDDLKKAVEHANLTDAVSDREVITKFARATVGHTERREIERFFDSGLLTAESVEELRSLKPRMERIARHLKDYEAELNPLVDALMTRKELKPTLEKRQEELADTYVREQR
ncbi:MAG: hypothetical protein O3A46_10750 [Candidatus Poribacteria bacterium]|nr:hypothetical protein [Candidatus Poribacteria bacterium]